jgi:hypothetical protein
LQQALAMPPGTWIVDWKEQPHAKTLRRQDERGMGLEKRCLSKGPCKQLFTYLKLKGLKLGFLLKFGADLMADGIERIVNGLPEVNLGVLASWRETQTRVEPVGAPSCTRLQVPSIPARP